MVKLVRDHVIPDDKKHQVHVAESEQEFRTYLLRKLNEEVIEFQQVASTVAMCGSMSDETIVKSMTEELADIYEVLEAIVKEFKLSAYEIRRIRDKKALAKGRFEKRLIWDSTIDSKRENPFFPLIEKVRNLP
jgi:predicted house-cleaning noncanonical NTP pyrophosphatase (MazG superfamily)